MTKSTVQRSLALAVDIGKTKLAVGLVDADGHVHRKDSVRTDLARGGATVVPQVLALLKSIASTDSNRARAIGLASTGIVDPVNGLLVSSGSIENWSDIPISRLLYEEFGLPSVVDNDVYAAGLGEAVYGAGGGAGRSLYFTISTGIGAAVVDNGHLVRGAHDLVGQIAHIPLPGSDRTINDVASGSGLARAASRVLDRDTSTTEIFLLAADGNETARSLIHDAAVVLGRVVAWGQCLIDPDRVVLGGSVATKAAGFFEQIQEHAESSLQAYARRLVDPPFSLRLAQLGDDAGLIGIGTLALRGATSLE
jgi:glucokinase